MSNDIFVWVEQFKGQPAAASWEAIGVARRLADELGGSVTACAFGGQGMESLAQEAISYGADVVLLAEDATLADFRVEPQAPPRSSSARLSVGASWAPRWRWNWIPVASPTAPRWRSRTVNWSPRVPSMRVSYSVSALSLSGVRRFSPPACAPFPSRSPTPLGAAR